MLLYVTSLKQTMFRRTLMLPLVAAQQCVELLIIGDYGTRDGNQAGNPGGHPARNVVLGSTLMGKL